MSRNSKRPKSSEKKIIKKAKEDASILLTGVNKKIENTIHEIRESQAEKEKTRLLREDMEALKKEVTKKEVHDDEIIRQKIEKLKRKEENRNKHRPDFAEVKSQKEEKVENDELNPGDRVKIKGQDSIGELMQIGEKKCSCSFWAVDYNCTEKED